MINEDQWAYVVEATSKPATTSTPGQRLELLRTALGLGQSITEDSVGCSVTLTVGSEFVTPAASNGLALELDLAQYAARSGPCVAACRDGEQHSIVIMSEEDAYPGFTTAALQHGVRSSLSLPLPSRPTAALNLYARSPNAFSDTRARATAALLAKCVARFLPEPVAGTDNQGLDVAKALARRSIVRAACDRLAETDGLDPAAAFHRLAISSRTGGSSIFDICHDVLGADSKDEQP